MPEGPARTPFGMADADPDAAFKLLAKVAARPVWRFPQTGPSGLPDVGNLGVK